MRRHARCHQQGQAPTRNWASGNPVLALMKGRATLPGFARSGVRGNGAELEEVAFDRAGAILVQPIARADTTAGRQIAVDRTAEQDGRARDRPNTPMLACAVPAGLAVVRGGRFAERIHHNRASASKPQPRGIRSALELVDDYRPIERHLKLQTA